MIFWLREGPDSLTVERSESLKHLLIRDGRDSYRGPAFPSRRFLGEVLAIVDSDDDGWAEILLTAYGYEGQSITAYKYTPDGPQKTVPSFAWGC